jgi:hypothetical protein
MNSGLTGLPRMSLRQHLLNRWSQLAIRTFTPIHRAYGLPDHPWHLARWEPTGPDVIVHNPWWNARWLMEARSCSVCGEMRTRAMDWDRG